MEEEYVYRPKKSLGQNFLRSEKALSTIIDAGDPAPNDIILEIGPGEGVLTERLLETAGKVVAVEKDDYLFQNLKVKFWKEIEENKLDLLHQDILELDTNIFSVYKDLTYKIVANIPYNITGAIIRKFLSADYQSERMVLLVQKEVAERIVARGEKESILSISVKVYGTPIYVEKVLAGSFTPAPKVDSAILLIKDISKDFFKELHENKFFELVRAGFSSKRKKLSSNLSNLYPREEVEKTFKELNLDTNTRAEDVKVEIWKEIAQKILK